MTKGEGEVLKEMAKQAIRKEARRWARRHFPEWARKKNLEIAAQYAGELAPEYWVVRGDKLMRVDRGLLTPEERRLISEQLRSAGEAKITAGQRV